MPMVIECRSCRSRFRISPELFQGARAARVRCRTCGKLILVPNRQAQNSRPPPGPESTPEPAFSPGAKGISSPDRGEETAPGTLEAPVPAPPPAAATPIKEKETVSLEEIVFPYSADRPTPRGKRRPFYARPSFLVAAFLLLLAGVAAYFHFTKAGQEQLSRLITGWESSMRGVVTASPAYDIRNVETYFTRETGGSTLLVFEGTVENAGTNRGREIQVRAILFDDWGRSIAEKTVYAGIVLDEGALPRMARAEIEEAMSKASQDDGTAVVLPQGAVPFMLVFADPPDTMASYRISAFDGK